jgi:hypothetical protein
MEINFVNGSKITTLDKDYKPSNAPMMMFGVDMAKPDSEDNSCISYYCSKCCTIFHVEHFVKGDYVSPKFYTECPSCGVIFKGWIQS